MKFTIPYRANWGENLCCSLRFFGRQGSKYSECVDLKMTTRDGYLWEAETATRGDKRNQLCSIHYYYRVLDANGETVRVESGDMARAYSYDPTKNYYFEDFWLDGGKEKALSGKALSGKALSGMALSGMVAPGKLAPGQMSKKLEVGESLSIDRLPFFEKTVVFKVRAPKLHPGERVALLGNHPALGNWNTERFLMMLPSSMGDDEYVLSVNVEPIHDPIEYKYVIVDGETNRFKRWEYGENRKLEEPVYQDDVYVLNGGDVRTKKVAPGVQFDFDTYIFDLDGTLLSTLEDLAASCNYALRVNHLPERTVEEVRMMVGNGVRKLMERATGFLQPEVQVSSSRSEASSSSSQLQDQAAFDRVYRDFRNHYLAHNLDHTQPYPGVMDMLSDLKARGKNIAVVSNKFYDATRFLCEHFFGNLVDVAIGEREGIRKKPAPDTVNEALRQLHADREKAVYIGDSDVDVETARNSGMPCISVLWGFRDQEFLEEHGATIYVSSPGQLA